MTIDSDSNVFTSQAVTIISTSTFGFNIKKKNAILFGNVELFIFIYLYLSNEWRGVDGECFYVFPRIKDGFSWSDQQCCLLTCTEWNVPFVVPFCDVQTYVTVENSSSNRQLSFTWRSTILSFYLFHYWSTEWTGFDNETVLRRDSWTLLVRGERQDVTYCHTPTRVKSRRNRDLFWPPPRRLTYRGYDGHLFSVSHLCVLVA